MSAIDWRVSESTSVPTVSVIIATYNWSDALRCALQSVLLQTLREIEIIIVGDACTDDSRAVANSFSDPRIHWINLDQHHGHQWGPNNEGLRRARAPWIAYLGHDDIWYPSHLECAIRVASERSADLVAGTTLLYGPPESGLRGLTGLFRSKQWGPSEWAPPSSLLHRRSLVNKAGYWRDPSTLALPSDVDFVKRLLALGVSTACTDELTVFKFNVGRRDTYKIKTNNEQQAMLRKIQTGIDFRHRELLDFVRAELTGKSFMPQMPPEDDGVEPGAVHRWNQTLKGTRVSFPPEQLRILQSRERFAVQGGIGWMEWHLEECDPKFGPFRWTGPQPRSTIEFPVWSDSQFLVRVHVLVIIHPELLPPRLMLNSSHVPIKVEKTKDGTYMLSARAPRQELPYRPISVTIEIEQTMRPCDLGVNDDQRRLGVAINWIELEPVKEVPS